MSIYPGTQTMPSIHSWTHSWLSTSNYFAPSLSVSYYVHLLCHPCHTGPSTLNTITETEQHPNSDSEASGTTVSEQASGPSTPHPEDTPQQPNDSDEHSDSQVMSVNNTTTHKGDWSGLISPLSFVS